MNRVEYHWIRITSRLINLNFNLINLFLAIVLDDLDSLDYNVFKNALALFDIDGIGICVLIELVI